MVKTPESPASLAAAIDYLDDRLSQRFIALDPSGYFVIKLDADAGELVLEHYGCLLYTSPSPRDDGVSRMPSSA